jgi:DNA-binding IclR family transcriptional regulator
MANSVPALEKGLDVLELLACESAGLTKTDIARRLHHSLSEIFRILLCLEKRGYIAKSEHGRFRVTLKLLTVGPMYPLAGRLLTEALPVMHGLSDRLNQSCYLGVLRDARVTVIANVDSPVSPALSIKTGSVIDLMQTAMGHRFLAHVSDETRTLLIGRWQRQQGKMTGASADLDAQLTLIGRNGYGENQSWETPGPLNISSPVLDARGEAFAVLGVLYLPRKHEPLLLDTVRLTLQGATNVLSSKLGSFVLCRGRVSACDCDSSATCTCWGSQSG